MRASRTLGRLLCNLFKNCFLVFPTELGNIAVPKKKIKEKKPQAVSAHRLTGRTNLSIPFHLGITLNSQLCLYLRHTDSSLFLAQNNYLFPQLHFSGAYCKILSHFKVSIFLSLFAPRGPLAMDPNCSARCESSRGGLAGLHIPSEAALTFFSLIDNAGFVLMGWHHTAELECSPCWLFCLSAFFSHTFTGSVSLGGRQPHSAWKTYAENIFNFSLFFPGHTSYQPHILSWIFLPLLPGCDHWCYFLCLLCLTILRRAAREIGSSWVWIIIVVVSLLSFYSSNFIQTTF